MVGPWMSFNIYFQTYVKFKMLRKIIKQLVPHYFVI